MDADGGNQRNLTRHPAFDGSPDWSPDGSQITFVSDRDGDLNIYLMAADGGNVTQITHLKWAGSPMWSPDGRYIGFQASIDDQQGQQVYVMDADGINRWQVSGPLPNRVIYFKGWSPDGTQILYMGFLGGLVKDSIVIIATLSLKRRKAVTHEQVPIPKMDSANAAWGADGESVLISLRKAGEKWDIYRFRLLDGQLSQLTDHPASDTSPNEWNPQLSISPQGLTPTRWGEIKSNSYRR